MNDEEQLIQECVELFQRLTKLYQQALDNNEKYKDIVKNLFKQLDGNVWFTQLTETYCGYDGRIEVNNNNYTIAGSISKNYQTGDFNRLVEDLTMGYYRCNNGRQMLTTYKLMDKIHELL